MKSIKLFCVVIIMIFSNFSFACSELGQIDFQLVPKKNEMCAKLAKQFAIEFANSIVKIEKKQGTYDGPQGGFKFNKSIPAVYTAKKRVGNSNLIGFNVGLNSKNKWECNYCVNMTLDSNDHCTIDSIQKFMCSK